MAIDLLENMIMMVPRRKNGIPKISMEGSKQMTQPQKIRTIPKMNFVLDFNIAMKGFDDLVTGRLAR